MNLKSKLRLTLTTLALTATTSLLAQPPHVPDLVTDGNRWTITAYDDSSPVHTQWATQGICFYPDAVVGTQQRYIWVSDTYPDWNGRATQEGDQIFMHGDFQWPYGSGKEEGHDGMEWEIVSDSRDNAGAGHWKEWAEDGSFGFTFGFANAKLKRVGKCKYDKVKDAIKASHELELPKDKYGNYISYPLGIPVDIQ
jgi:hypothetical protein